MGPARLKVEQHKTGRVRGEGGTASVELALVLPLLLVLAFGVIGFGMTYNNYVTLREGTRAAAREGAAGVFGPTVSSSCQLTGWTGVSDTDLEQLACLAKNQIGLNAANTRVDIISGNSTFTSAGTFSLGDSIIVCVMYRVDGLAGLASSVLATAVLKAKTSMEIETTYNPTQTGGAETPLPNSNWNWCTISGNAP